MQLALMEEFNGSKKQRAPGRNTVLTPRDLEIIEFISDMKFASVTEVFEKFFKVTLSEKEAISDLWAKNRFTCVKRLACT